VTWCRGWEPLAAFGMRKRSRLARIVGERNKAISPPDSATQVGPALLHFATAGRIFRETDPWEAQPDLRFVV